VRSTTHAGEDASGVIVHHACAEDMEREGGWETVTD
jgi:hypothetical protein